MNKVLKCLVLGLVMSSASYGMHIQEINSLKEIKTTNFKKGTLLLLDLDETVLVDKKHTPKKYKHLIRAGEEYRLIESDVAQTVEKLKTCVGNDNANVVVLGITKRDRKKNGKWDRGHLHLKEARIPVSRKKFVHLNDVKLCKKTNPYYDDGAFKDGVLFTNHQDKGMYLEAFCKKANFTPASIVMADDKVDNLKSVERYANKINVPMRGYQMKGAKKLK